MQVNVNEEKELTLQKRRSIIIWVYSLKQLKTLKRYGLIQYVSRRMKYIVLYMNEEEIESAEAKINGLHFVRKVERSYRPDVEMNFAEKIGTKAAYQYVEEEGFEVEEINTQIRLAENV
ncbi:YlbG family protein [Enterococcus sp. BWB1-3]|uniref:YlbG family protein n=1 Tax=unclassified Enterococcus TaxID=2608891 RepID=UPI001922611D|nr:MULTISPECIES: YlbG family protein [unclassified Enterococcus]MBL1229534.1 YlbG family protein [Enterococcus sp. BWB1-3]MCB5950775.1 YlbG family protein [Enterococcus sp. BWT-B8]MCB5955216.1 YlbG family protein [Enterococcus sp. CWB-B31]